MPPGLLGFLSVLLERLGFWLQLPKGSWGSLACTLVMTWIEQQISR